MQDRSQGHFTQVESQILNREDLSFRAKGILLYLLSKPPDWKVIVGDIIKRGGEGREAIRSGLQELEMAGYIRRTRSGIPRQSDLWEVFENPKMAKQILRNPSSPGARKIHRIEEHLQPFTQISNAILNNSRLKYASKGMLAYLLSKPNTWRVSMKDVEKHGTEGREAVKSSFKELEDKGHLIRSKLRSSISGKLKGYQTLVFECPNDAQGEDPTVGPPTDGHPNNGKPSTTKKDNTNIPPKSPQQGGIALIFDPGKEEGKFNQIAHPGGADAPSFPGYTEQDKLRRHHEEQRSLPARIIDLDPDQRITQGLAMKMVHSDPLAQGFHELFPDPEWTPKLARMFCNRVKNGMINKKSLNLFRWYCTLNGKMSLPSSKLGVLKNEWRSIYERLLTEKAAFVHMYSGRLERLRSTESGSAPDFAREAERLAKEDSLPPSCFAPVCVPFELIAIKYTAAVVVGVCKEDAEKFNCKHLDAEDKKLLLMTVIQYGEIFSCLDKLEGQFDSKTVFGFDWSGIQAAREKLEAELQENIRYIRDDL